MLNPGTSICFLVNARVYAHHLLVFRLGDVTHAKVERLSDFHPMPWGFTRYPVEIPLRLLILLALRHRPGDFLGRGAHHELAGRDGHKFIPIELITT